MGDLVAIVLETLIWKMIFTLKSAIAEVCHASLSSGFSTFVCWPVFERLGFTEHVLFTFSQINSC